MKRRLGRRRLLLGGAALAGAALTDAFGIEPRWLDVTRHDVLVPNLPRALEGFTIAQITDAHLRAVGRVEERIIEVVRSENVPLVLMTGDIVDGPAGLGVLSELGSALKRAGAEVIASLGNWEHWAGFTPLGLAKEYARFGGRLLVNEATAVEGVDVVATDDGYAGAPRWDHTLESLGSDVDTQRPRLLMTHSPAMFELAPYEAPRFELALAGHTHGGQLRFGPFAPLVPPGSGRFVAGFYETRLGRAYVSRGTGMSIVPARFACRPELPLFRLRAA